MNARSLLALSFFLTFLVAGCNRMAPGCDDFRTRELVLNSTRNYLTSLLGNDSVETLNIDLDNVKTLSSDRKTGTCYCSADLVFSKEGWEDRIAITYQSELSKDKENDFTVTLDDL